MRTPRGQARERIQNALLELLKSRALASITVTQLCEASGVGRSTFYSHYGGVVDVYRETTLRLIRSIRTVRAQLHCADCADAAEGAPFCEVIRKSERHRGLVCDEQFVPTFLSIVQGELRETPLEFYRDMGLDAHQALGVFVFHVMGCFMAARSVEDDESWSETQPVLDKFIRAGFGALR